MKEKGEREGSDGEKEGEPKTRKAKEGMESGGVTNRRKGNQGGSKAWEARSG